MTIVIGDELSDEERIFQRPGPEIFPAVGICLDICDAHFGMIMPPAQRLICRKLKFPET